MVIKNESQIENVLGNIAAIKQNTKNRSERIYLRVSKSEKDSWINAADSFGVGLSDFIRTIMNYSQYV